MCPAVEIDHIVHDRGGVAGELDAVTIAGSDHKALLGTLEVREKTVYPLYPANGYRG